MIIEGFESMSSLGIHAARSFTPEHSHLMPIFATSTFTFDSAERGMKRFSGKEPGYIYSRFGNLTTDAAAETMAALEAFGLFTISGAPLEPKALLHAAVNQP